jgi:hypothetical protein
MTTRILPKAGGGGVLVNGNRYTLTDSNVRDIVDADAAAIAASGAGTIIGTIGPTSSRPTAPALGALHLDTQLSGQPGGKPVWFDGQKWLDATGARS